MFVITWWTIPTTTSVYKSFWIALLQLKLRLSPISTIRWRGQLDPERGGLQAGDPDAVFVYSKKSCGGIASVVAGGTKVWMRRNGHQGEMESSFRGGRHAHTCACCLHWAGTLHADAFQRSRWAHQIRIHVFTLDFSLPKCVHVCVCVWGFCALSC